MDTNSHERSGRVIKLIRATLTLSDKARMADAQRIMQARALLQSISCASSVDMSLHLATIDSMLADTQEALTLTRPKQAFASMRFTNGGITR